MVFWALDDGVLESHGPFESSQLSQVQIGYVKPRYELVNETRIGYCGGRLSGLVTARELESQAAQLASGTGTAAADAACDDCAEVGPLRARQRPTAVFAAIVSKVVSGPKRDERRCSQLPTDRATRFNS